MTLAAVVGVAVWLGGLGHFALLAASGQIPARLCWRTELHRLSDANRKLFLVATSYIVFTYLSFGVLTFVLHNELIRGDRAAVALAVFIGLYWLVRLVLDWVWFGHRDWPPGRRFVLAHVALELLFAYLAITYLGLAAWHLIP
jgi:VanZ family protein